MVMDHRYQPVLPQIDARQPRSAWIVRYTRTSTILMVSGILGCQSGLVDPGRSRGTSRPMQPLSIPAPPAVQPTVPQGPAFPSGNLPPGSTPPGSTPPGSTPSGNDPSQSTSHDWKHVSRQPATSVIKLSPTDDAKAKYHKVQPGETWSSLARQFGLSVKQLADANGINPSTPLQQGQLVYIP